MAEVREIKGLARRISRSESTAFRAMFDSYHAAIFRFLLFKLGENESAEDLTQDVFVRVWENRRRLREDLSLKSYLYTIARNLASNHIRHNKVVLKFQREQNYKAPGPETPSTEFDATEIRETLMAAVARLPEHSRVPFMMSRFEGLTYKEIAARLNISVKTVESHIGRALKLLRQSLQAVG